MDYELIRSDRKTLSMSVTNELTIRVKAPLIYPKSAIDEFVNSHANWIMRQIGRQKAQNSLPPLDEKRIAELKALAAVEIPRRVEYYSNIMGLNPISVKITSAKTRFGSCSGKNGLCFSYRLMLYPPEAVDYVVVHELAHIKEKNHSSAFYSLVSVYLPDYKEREKLLKRR